MTAMLSSKSSKTMSEQVARVEREKQGLIDKQKAQFEAKLTELQREVSMLHEDRVLGDDYSSWPLPHLNTHRTRYSKSLLKVSKTY